MSRGNRHIQTCAASGLGEAKMPRATVSGPKVEWTPAMIERLRELADAGTGPAETAKRLGVTRNAALGQAYRSGITFRSSPQQVRRPVTLRRFTFEEPGE